MYIKSLRGAGEIACKGHQDVHFGSDVGFGIPVRSKIGQDMRIHFKRLVSWYGRKQLIPQNVEDNTFNIFLSKEVKSIETQSVNNSQQLGIE